MNSHLTISDSKKSFYKEFPYVIPHIYRRVADELIVELHLLSHLKEFTLDDLFAVGLNRVFSDLTVGYKPTDHLDKLFDAICNCTDIEPKTVRNKSQELIKSMRDHSYEEILSLSQTKSSRIKDIFINKNSKYSRLTIIGIYVLIKDLDDNNQTQEELIKTVINIGDCLGFSQQRIEKDITSYMHSIEKIQQFIELQLELNKKRK